MKEDGQFVELKELTGMSESDLSKNADLSVALMNLISIEEHLEFSFAKTSDEKYLDFLESARKIRRVLLAKLVGSPPAEEWCISKHLLASSMRLFEVGTKELDFGNKIEAASCFNLGFDLYSMFFALNTKLEVKKIMAIQENEKGFWASKIIKKIVNCCKE